MKKQLLLSVMVLVGLSASAQFSPKPSVVPQTKSKVMNVQQSQRSLQFVGPRQDLGVRCYAPTNRLTLDPARVKPVTRSQFTSVAKLPALQNQAKLSSKVQNHQMVNLKPTLTLTPQAKAQSKAPEFAKKYTATGLDYFTGSDLQWTMTPSTATYTNEETGEEESVDVLVDVIPTPSYFADLYPSGIPMEYTMDGDTAITIVPQVIASYMNETEDTTFYVTIFSPLTEDGAISISVGENGKLTITDGEYIGIGEFAFVEFDAAWSESESFYGFDELTANVAYYYRYETTISERYNAHGVDYFANEPVDWVMERGTRTIDDEVTNFFINMTPLIETFAGIYPNGIDVEYEQEDGDRAITVRPQVIASIPADEENEAEYIMIFSATSADGNIVLTEDKTGLLTIEDEGVIIGAWSTEEFDPSYETYLGGYIYIDNPKYRLPDAPAEAPADVACEPEELVLFAGPSYSGYGYNDNLAMIGAYAPTHFRNCTFDIATGFDWSVLETDRDGVESTIKSNDRNFTLNTKGDYTYEDFSLIAYNEKEASEPYAWGTGHALNEDGSARYEAIHVYAGQGASSFTFTDGSYATMTRQNPDFDLSFYVNWGTPNYAEQYGIYKISTIYSYQGKPATPLYLTGVTLPMGWLETNDDFNLHIKLCKCTRSATGNLTVGDVIAEGDATTENVVDGDYVSAVEFTELYVEDEFGMSETVDYLFIEDEFVIIIEGWDNGTFSGVLGNQEYNFNENTSTWFQVVGETRMRSYGGGWPQLFIGLLDATYGYLYTEDDTDLKFDNEGGTSTIHIDPMYYGIDEETEEPTYSLYVESITEDGEEVEEVPEWLTFEVANEDYTTDVDEDGYDYFVNGIDYDLVVTAEALPEGVEYRTAQVVFYQKGAKLTVKVAQGVDPDGINTVVATPIKNSRAFNLAGQPVGKNYKGIIVKDGKKVLVK